MENNETQEKELPVCPMNEGVICWPGEHKCPDCGWNPVVSKARLNRFCSTHKVRLPEEKTDKLT